ncbi:MAG: hypothetical protein KBG48_00595 [Kofleriaceae bacterium]|jgi:hypothetical protein|nr:hypothetical protein [Kofleriaceae bacterium]MBP9165842.1 hypothetical protein [Kofleriaceae bacterium]MBP9861719.1 hypothetical protein [Kofleriaceae bacterium]
MRIAIVSLIVAVAAACGDEGGVTGPDAPTPDAGVVDASAPDAACFTSPQTHVEIINACTTAEKIDRQPVLPLLRPDGSLPPLP